MVYGNTLCQLGHVLDEWDRDGATIRSVVVDQGAGGESGTRPKTEVTLGLPMALSGGTDEPVVECTPAVTDEGSLAVNVETNVRVPPVSDSSVDIEPVESTVHADGTVDVTVAVSVADESERGEQSVGDDETQMQGERASEEVGEETEPESDGEAGRTREVPPFKDPELLQEVYDTHDTFAEMAEALEMDVTGETVRRYMIDFDIHQPNSYRSGTRSTSDEETDDGDSSEGNEIETDSQQLVAISDGIGLPDGVSVEDVIETVNRSNTIYEVKKDLDLDRQEAHAMLKDLNLMDLVLGRLSDDSGREITREDVVQRLREVSESRRNADPKRRVFN